MGRDSAARSRAGMPELSGTDSARLALLEALADEGRQFVPPGPNAYRRLRRHRGRSEAARLQHVFGWNL